MVRDLQRPTSHGQPFLSPTSECPHCPLPPFPLPPGTPVVGEWGEAHPDLGEVVEVLQHGAGGQADAVVDAVRQQEGGHQMVLRLPDLPAVMVAAPPSVNINKGVPGDRGANAPLPPLFFSSRPANVVRVL